MSDCVKLWRKDLHKINPKAAESLADPGQYKNLFPNYDAALQVEAAERATRGRLRPAGAYAQYAGSNMRDLIEEMGSMGLDAGPRLNGTGDAYHEPMDEGYAGDAQADAQVDAASPVDDPPVFVRCAAAFCVGRGMPHRSCVHHSAEPPAPPAPVAPPAAPPMAPPAAPPGAPPAIPPAVEEDDLLGLGDDDDDLDLDVELADDEDVDDDGWGLEDDDEEK